MVSLMGRPAKALIGLIGFFTCTYFASALTSTPARAGCEELHTAVESGNYAVIDQELAWSTDINCLNAQGEAPLHTAVYTLNSSLVSYLLSRGASVNIFDNMGGTPLDIAWAEYEYATESELGALESVIDVLENAGGYTF